MKSLGWWDSTLIEPYLEHFFWWQWCKARTKTLDTQAVLPKVVRKAAGGAGRAIVLTVLIMLTVEVMAGLLVKNDSSMVIAGERWC